MPSTVTSPNMNIVVPVVLTDTGPDWATRVYNALFSTIDAHNHTSGNGVQVPTAGININADLAFGSNNATSLRSARFTSQASALNLGSDVGCAYNVLGDLYWNNAVGTAIQLTKNGLVNVGSFTAPFNMTAVTKAGSYVIDSGGADCVIFANTSGAAWNLTLPTPTAGRTLFVVDSTGSFAANNLTLVRHGAESINGVAASKALSAAWAIYVIVSDGTNWFVRGI
ncbi:MAG TPA: hypothetical protein VE987_14670 [Polyangiaceae bacterium]|nr:hypothetical protein [Polyangiaceae bacterium]